MPVCPPASSCVQLRPRRPNRIRDAEAVGSNPTSPTILIRLSQGSCESPLGPSLAPKRVFGARRSFFGAGFKAFRIHCITPADSIPARQRRRWVKLLMTVVSAPGADFSNQQPRHLAPVPPLFSLPPRSGSSSRESRALEAAGSCGGCRSSAYGGRRELLSCC